MLTNKLFSASAPTFPIQDKFGQTIIQFGMSHIDVAMIHIASGMVANQNVYNGQLDPDVIADESWNIAIAIFEKIDTEYKKASAIKAESNLITTDKEWPTSKM